MDVLQRIPYSDTVMDMLQGYDEWLQESLTAKAVVVGAVVGLAVYLMTKKKCNMPPGPRGWPLVGNLLDFRGTTIYDKLIEWKAIYGPIITFKVGPETMVALNNKDVVMEALVKNQADIAGRPQSYFSLLFSDGGKSIKLGDYSPTWKLHRKIATKALRHYMTGTKLEQSIENALAKGVELLKQQKGPFNPHRYTSNIVFNIINNICFARTCEIDDEYFKVIIGVLDSFLVELGNGLVEDFIPPLRLFPSKKLKRLVSQANEYFARLNTEIDRHRRTFDRDNMRDFCDMVLLAQEEARQEEDPALLSQITHAHVTHTVSDIFEAGLDTSRFTLLWCLFYLSIHQDIQKKLHEEIDQAFGDRLYPKLSDRQNLQYTDAVLYEVMRMSSVAAMGIPHKTIKDTKVGKYDIPKGTTVVINHFALHHDPEEWSDPEVFDPERYLDANGKMAPKPDSWLPFSAGRRVCLGESVAKPELHLLLAGIMRHFKVSFPPGAKVDFTRVGGSFANVPKDFEIFMEPRV